MADGIYQSAIVFFMPYLLYAPATPINENGLDLMAQTKLGVYVACSAIIVMNFYILLNTNRWDWFLLLITGISTLLIFFWTGVYTSFTSDAKFYKAGAEVYGALSFWAVTLLTVIICLLPRFGLKFLDKYFFPTDNDIIREQVIQGKFKYLDADPEHAATPKIEDSAASSESSNRSPAKSKPNHKLAPSLPDSERPFYPPSVAATATTKNPRSQNGSDETYHSRPSFDMPPRRPSLERVRSSFEQSRRSMDKLRPSFEASRDFTSAAYLSRIESSHSQSNAPVSPQASRRRDISEELR